MQTIPQEQILARIRVENPWWQPPHQVPGFLTALRPRPYRRLFEPLVTQTKVRRAVVLMGPRRVGKTVLLHHTIQQLLSDGVDPRHLCYVSVDHPLYVGCSLQRFVEIYSEAVGLDPRRESCFVLFDEIQYLKDWEIHLKSLVDDFPLVRFVASGSAAAALRLKSRESGAGRFTEFLLPPLTFHEYLSLHGEDTLVEIAVAALREQGIDEVEISALNDRFVDYLNYGGYPEVAFSKEIQREPGRFVKSDIIDKVLLRDLPSLYGINDIQELNALFTTLAFNTAQEVSLNELSKTSGVSKPTLKKYVEYLEAAFLLRVIHRVDRNARHFRRATFFKVYLTNPSIHAALFSAVDHSSPNLGALVETGTFAQWFHHQPLSALHYARWRDGEVDLVGVGPRQDLQWAVEVKWSDRAARKPALISRAIDFCARNNLGRLIVTTRLARRRVRRSNVDVDFVPAAAYCCEVGRRIVEGEPPTAQLSLF